MLTPEPFRILVVCIGNVCRSPFAERLLTQRFAEAGAGAAYEVSSAGTYGMVGRGMEPDAADQLRAYGGDPDGFVARRVDEALVTAADLVLTATVDVRRQLLEEAPGALRRTFTLRELAALVDGVEASSAAELVADAARRRTSVSGLELDVPDPMGRGTQAHEHAAEVAAAAVEIVVSALVQAAGTPATGP